MKKFALVLIISCFLLLSSAHGQSLGLTNLSDSRISLAINLIPDQMNDDMIFDDGGYLNDDAYMQQISLVWKGDSGGFQLYPPFNHTYKYFSLRRMRFITEYREDGARGMAELEVMAFIYGNRYMAGERYRGLGVGWYAGWALGTDRYVEIYSPGDTPSKGEDDASFPVIAAELFYKWHPVDFLFLETSFTFGLDQDSSSFHTFPSINLGVEF
ncbi:hypothetical protein [Marinospirillum alkaliphilum]|uniref:Outer membrane protein beta-barrel domain-containing protein n=1 Tax=Marinospirillum alkaliphilum DSM 21637 TaxID=1122209 RepID=A0A1K1ZN95_9GAMM|nr:hypothetical protein [Marinospirillum alkaliphilum]SFX75730.1 hypothetical protein SAMN02745752_02784 [Marinospirillum alkaliphilum DSM 21637]